MPAWKKLFCCLQIGGQLKFSDAEGNPVLGPVTLTFGPDPEVIVTQVRRLAAEISAIGEAVRRQQFLLSKARQQPPRHVPVLPAELPEEG